MDSSGGNNYNFTSKNEDRIGILDLYADYQLLPELTLGLGNSDGMVAATL